MILRTITMKLPFRKCIQPHPSRKFLFIHLSSEKQEHFSIPKKKTTIFNEKIKKKLQNISNKWKIKKWGNIVKWEIISRCKQIFLWNKFKFNTHTCSANVSTLTLIFTSPSWKNIQTQADGKHKISLPSMLSSYINFLAS